MSTLNELAAEIHADARAKGFYDRKRRLPEILTLLHSEVSEAFEAWRDEQQWEMEIVDVVIVALDLLASAHADIDEMLAAKMAINRRRAHKHGRRI